MDRNEALITGCLTRPKRTPFVVDFHPTISRVGRVINGNFHIVESSKELNAIIAPPVVAFRRPRNIKDILVRAKIRTNTREQPRVC